MRTLGQYLGVTRQALHAHLRPLLEQELLVKTGTTRPTYRLAVLEEASGLYAFGNGFDEDVAFSQVVKPLLGRVPEAKVRAVVEYTFAEMCNNAIDHSGDSHVYVTAARTAAGVSFSVMDHGVGIFRKITAACGLENEREAIFELSKGKLTTDKARHTGEGIFFTARMADHFVMMSHGLAFHAGQHVKDWLIEYQDGEDSVSGTYVRVTAHHVTAVDPATIFDKFTSDQDGDHTFAKTNVIVHLAEYGTDGLVSRSQARRVVNRLERFQTVCFDFENVKMISPAFADQIFRVFANEQPRMSLSAINMNVAVRRMVTKAQVDRARGEE